MPAKPDAHHVINLPLVPIGGAPDRRYGGQLGLFFAHISLESQVAVVSVAVKLIDHRPARVGPVIIDTANVHEVVEAKFLFSPRADRRDLLSFRQPERDFAAKFGRRGEEIAELRFEFWPSSRAVMKWT